MAQFIVPRLRPKLMTTIQSRRLRPPNRGRVSASSTIALVASRSQTIAVGEISPKSPLATAAPTCTERIPMMTSHTGPRREITLPI